MIEIQIGKACAAILYRCFSAIFLLCLLQIFQYIFYHRMFTSLLQPLFSPPLFNGF